MRETLAELARRICAKADAISKPLAYYSAYDLYLSDAPDDLTLMELGVHTGESLKVWASYFPRGTIIGIDSLDHKIDFSAYPNIVFVRADCTDAGHLGEICRMHAPAGLDLVIDDASHIAQSSAASYAALFPLLKQGGLYCIEDWGTGYFDDWPDGSHLQRARAGPPTGDSVKRFLSHDFGMVGFIKSLIDELASDKSTRYGAATRPAGASFVHVNPSFVVVKKG